MIYKKLRMIMFTFLLSPSDSLSERRKEVREESTIRVLTPQSSRPKGKGVSSEEAPPDDALPLLSLFAILSIL